MQNLENYIKENRSAFDEAYPSLKIWANINDELEKNQGTRRIRLWKTVRIAASILILVGLGFVFGTQFNQTPLPGIAQQGELIPEDFKEVEGFYKKQYQQKVNQLANYQIDPAFKNDLETFESVMEELKQELIEAPKGNEERIIGAIIQNYQMKIEILERIQDRMENNENSQINSKTKRNETSI